MSKSKVQKYTESAKLRAAFLRRGMRVTVPEPQAEFVWAVRYIRENGNANGRYFVMEHAARAYADRLKAQGKEPAIFRTTRTVRWTRFA